MIGTFIIQTVTPVFCFSENTRCFVKHSLFDFDFQVLSTYYQLVSPEVAAQTPKQFPNGVLLGCVDVIDCLPQWKYRKNFPEGEISDAFVFICENPQPLKTPFPMRGKPKIYKLEPRLHHAARKQVMCIPGNTP